MAVDGCRAESGKHPSLENLYIPNTTLPNESATAFDTPNRYMNNSPGTAESVLNLQHLSIPQLMRLAEAQMIESQLEKKHRRELLHHVLRQKVEMRELKKQLGIVRKPFNYDENSGTSMSLSSNSLPASPSTLVPSPLGSKVTESAVKEAEWEVLGNSNVPDVPISPDLGPITAEVPWGNMVEDNTRLLSSSDIKTQEITRELEEFSLQAADKEFPSVLRGKWPPREKPMPTNNTVGENLRMKKQLYPYPEGHRKGKNPFPEDHTKGQKFNTHLFKTEVCRSWSELGYCPYGDSCQFAHGAQELRVRPMIHKKYKTVRCKKFLAGHCPYGSRCCFVHSLHEQRLPVSNRPSNMMSSSENLLPGWPASGRYGLEFGRYGGPRSIRDMDMSRRWNGRATAYHPKQ